MRALFSLLLTTLLIISCQSDSTDKTEVTTKSKSSPDISFTSLSAGESGVDFTNYINENATRNGLTYDYMYNGAGVAISDFNNDGLQDLFFCGNDADNKIYKNTGNLKFEDVSSSALPPSKRWAFGATIVDINNDGLQDIYICNSGPDLSNTVNELYVNQGDFKFTEEAAKYGLDVNSYSMQASFFDYDQDGDLDVWINNHGNSKDVAKVTEITKANTDDGSGLNMLQRLNKVNDNRIAKGKLTLLRRDGDKFTDVSKAAGIHTLAYGLGMSVADYNDDGLLDVYVANDFWIPDYYFINNGNGTFTNRMDYINHTSYYAMGTDAADYNNDNILDLSIVDMTPKDHYRNKTLMESMDVQRFNVLTDVFKFTRQYMFNSFHVGMGNGQFSEIANALNVSLTDWSWAPLMFDMNNDGYNDLYITNGYYRDTKNQDYRHAQDALRKQMKKKYTSKVAHEELLKVASTPVANGLFANNDQYQYNDVTQSGSNLGDTFSNGAAYADLDNDGDLDLVINNLTQKASILRNDSKSQNYLTVKINAQNEADIKHAKIVASLGEKTIRRDYSFTRGYQSCMAQEVYFGLGDATQIDQLQITWPNGNMSTFDNVLVNQKYEIDYASAAKTQIASNDPPALFRDISKVMHAYQVKHSDKTYDEFAKEILLPHKYSNMGPALAVGDLNKDGFDDFYMGGSQGQPGKLMLMKGNKFFVSSAATLAADQNYEDIGAHFFDVNGDGFLDLYVASGGGGDIQSDNLLQDRLYINNGQGEFLRSGNSLPIITSSTKCIVSFDFDNDGDQDLFVGGRNVPGQYPSKAKSYLLQNDNGIFKDIMTTALEEVLSNMVTDAVTTDYNNDGYLDLVVVGEWSAPQLLINDQKSNFTPKEDENLSQLKGWWHSIEKSDFNGDGQDDFIVGNIGLNNKFHPNAKKPLDLYYDDFDDNGSVDIVLAKQYNGKTVPVRGKECSSEQMPILNEKFETYDAFASSSLEDILGKSKVRNSKNLRATTFSSVAMLRSGDSYTTIDLPFAAQWSPIMDMEILDLNADGKEDVIIAGNLVNTEPETPSYDAGKGIILYSNGDGTFKADYDTRSTGINLNKNVKQLETMRTPGGEIALIAGNNNDFLQIFLMQ